MLTDVKKPRQCAALIGLVISGFLRPLPVVSGLFYHVEGLRERQRFCASTSVFIKHLRINMK